MSLMPQTSRTYQQGMGGMHLSTVFTTIDLSRVYILWKRTGFLRSSPSFADALREMKENLQKISRACSEIIAQRLIIRSCGFDITLNPDQRFSHQGLLPKLCAVFLKSIQQWWKGFGLQGSRLLLQYLIPAVRLSPGCWCLLARAAPITQVHTLEMFQK